MINCIVSSILKSFSILHIFGILALFNIWSVILQSNIYPDVAVGGVDRGFQYCDAEYISYNSFSSPVLHVNVYK